MAIDDHQATETPTEVERDALHSVTLGMEWLQRAHGHLLAFHHNVGHAMDHFAEAEGHLREAGHTDLADAIRTEYLPRGVVDEDRWSYDVVEDFEGGVLADMDAFETTVRKRLADGERHVAERAQERAWKARADDR
jgi:hypothetical protein